MPATSRSRPKPRLTIALPASRRSTASRSPHCLWRSSRAIPNSEASRPGTSPSSSERAPIGSAITKTPARSLTARTAFRKSLCEVPDSTATRTTPTCTCSRSAAPSPATKSSGTFRSAGTKPTFRTTTASSELRKIIGQCRIVFLYDRFESRSRSAAGRLQCVGAVAGRILSVEVLKHGQTEIVFQPGVLTTRTALLAVDTITQQPWEQLANRYIYKLQLTQ